MTNDINRFYWKFHRRCLIIWDLLRGVDFARNNSRQRLGYADSISTSYAASPAKDLKMVLKRFKIGLKDAILDLGAGKGAAMLTMLKFPFYLVGGVELSRYLYEIAVNNFNKLNKSNVMLYCSDVKDFNDYDTYNYFYLYHPFPASVFKVVLNKMIESYYRNPRKMIVIYYNPPSHREAINSQHFFLHSESINGKYHNVDIYIHEI